MTLRRPFRPEFTGDRQADQAQRSQDVARQAIVRSGIALGRLAFDTDSKVADISFSAGVAKRILHGLDLKSTPGGWFVVDVSAAGTFYRTAWDTSSITLMPSATCTARVWVFP